jgi:hypothetical protein
LLIFIIYFYFSVTGLKKINKENKFSLFINKIPKIFNENYLPEENLLKTFLSNENIFRINSFMPKISEVNLISKNKIK